MIETIPKVWLAKCLEAPFSAIAMRRKELGIWRQYSWKEYYAGVRDICLGLKSLGLGRGNRVAMPGGNCAELYWAMIGCQAAGGVVVALYPDFTDSEMEHIFRQSEPQFVIADAEEQVEKVLGFKKKYSLRAEDWPIILSYEKLRRLGKNYEESHPDIFERLIEEGRGEEIAVLSYTSGISSFSKGVLWTHKSVIAASKRWIDITGEKIRGDIVSHISPAWLPEFIHSIGVSLIGDAKVNFCEQPETTWNDVREISPTYMVYFPRVWEEIMVTSQARIGDANTLVRLIFNFAISIGERIIEIKENGREVGLFWKFIYEIANLVIMKKVRDKLGLSKLKYAWTGGGDITTECLRFFHSIGVNLRQVYGTTEIWPIALSRYGETDLKSLGMPTQGVEVKISPDGEIQTRASDFCIKYAKDSSLGDESIVDGWFRTGDSGFIDKNGALFFEGRISDRFSLVSGQNRNLRTIESELKKSPYIRDVVTTFAEDRSCIIALVVFNFSNVGRWARNHRVAYNTVADLAQKKEIVDLIGKEVKEANKSLPAEIKVRRFVILDKLFDPNEGDFSRPMNLNRKNIISRFQDSLENSFSCKIY